MPHLTEVLWQSLPNSIKEVPALIVAKYPEVDETLVDNQIEDEFTLAMNIIKEIRRVRKDFNVKLTINVPLIIHAKEKAHVFRKVRKEIIALGKVDSERFIIDSSVVAPPRSARIVGHGIIGYISLDGLTDLEKVRLRIINQLKKVNNHIDELTIKLSGSFAERAKAEIVQKEKDKLLITENIRLQLEEQLNQIK